MYGSIARVLLALSACGLTAAQTTSHCATGVHAILARQIGTGDDLSVLVKIQNEILDNIPGSTSVAIPYNHDPSATEIFPAISNGGMTMQRYVREYVASCPNAKIVMFGYSLGAIVTMEAICGTTSLLLDPISPLEPKYNKNVIAAVTYGDETHVPLMPWNVGNCTEGVGLFPRLNAAISCAPYKASLHSYCDFGDDDCCGPLPPDNNAGHHDYFQKYDNNVLAFIKQRIAQTK